MKKMKVYTGSCLNTKTLVACDIVVAATSMKAACRIVNEAGIKVSYSHMNKYWMVSFVVEKIDAAMTKPGVVFQNSRSFGKDYKEVEK